MYFFSYLVPKWPKCNYSTIIQLCFVLFWFICSQNPKIYRPTWLGFVPMPQTWLSGNISHKVSCDLVSPWKFLFHDSNTFLSKIGWIHLIVFFQNKSVSHYDSHMGTPTENRSHQVKCHTMKWHLNKFRQRSQTVANSFTRVKMYIRVQTWNHIHFKAEIKYHKTNCH